MIAPVDVMSIRLETPRLILRAWREADLEDFYEYAKVDGVGQMAGWLPHKSQEESKIILEHFIRDKKTFAVEYKETGKVIGSIGLEARDSDDLKGCGREIGYVLAKPYWGNGLMPEAVKAVIAHCFDELGFDWLTCGHFVSNDQSRRVVEKCGFRYIRDMIHETRFGTQEPTKLYLMDKDDYIFLKMNAPFDVTGTILETERLILRPMEEGDYAMFRTMAVMPELAEVSGWDWHEPEDETKIRFQRALNRKDSFVLVDKQSGRMIGTLSVQGREWPIYPIDRSLKGREFGFDLIPNYWGRGLMPEAVRAVTAHCYETLGFDFLTVGYFHGNTRSQRVIEKTGFSYLFDFELPLSEERTVMVTTFIRYKEN